MTTSLVCLLPVWIDLNQERKEFIIFTFKLCLCWYLSDMQRLTRKNFLTFQVYIFYYALLFCYLLKIVWNYRYPVSLELIKWLSCLPQMSSIDLLFEGNSIPSTAAVSSEPRLHIQMECCVTSQLLTVGTVGGFPLVGKHCSLYATAFPVLSCSPQWATALLFSRPCSDLCAIKSLSVQCCGDGLFYFMILPLSPSLPIFSDCFKYFFTCSFQRGAILVFWQSCDKTLQTELL